MNNTLTSEFKALLLQQRQDLLQQLAAQRGDVSRVEAAVAHRSLGDNAHDQAFGERELELILDDRETVELQLIAAALKRIEAGSYGECTDCGTEIPAARLRAAPEAARCVACQSRSEAHGQRSG